MSDHTFSIIARLERINRHLRWSWIDRLVATYWWDEVQEDAHQD